MLTKQDNVEEVSIEFNYFKEKLSFEFKYLKSYIEHMNSSIADRVEQLESIVTADLDSNPDKEKVIMEVFFNEVAKIKSYFYNSSIVLIYTVYESTLNQICNEVANGANAKLSHEHLKDKNISKKFLTYLELIGGINYLEEKKLYDRIVNFQSLRNQIVHQNSKVKGDTDTAKKNNANKMNIMFNFGIEDENDYNIEINSKTWDFHIKNDVLVNEFLDLIETYLKSLINTLEKQVFIVPKL